MLDFIPITSKNQSLIVQWLTGDSIGLKELASYIDVDKWVDRPNPTPRYKWLLFKPNRHIGFIDLETYSDGRASFSFYIAPVERGKGLSKQVLQELLLKAQELGIKELFAGVNEMNITSQRALRSAGFLEKGRDKDNYILFTKLIS